MPQHLSAIWGTWSPLGAGVVVLAIAILLVAHDDHPRTAALLAMAGAGGIGWGSAGLIAKYTSVDVAGLQLLFIGGLLGLVVMYLQLWRGKRTHAVLTPVIATLTGLFLAVSISSANVTGIGQFGGHSLVTISHPGPPAHHHHGHHHAGGKH